MPFEGDKQPTTWAEATKRLRQKASEGKISDTDLFGDDPLAPKKTDPYSYLGHMANDEVAEQGHNTPDIKRIAPGSHAAKGYRVIPGNANTGYVAKKIRDQMDVAASASGPFRYGGPIMMGPCGPMPGTDEKAPLRARDRAAKAAAPAAKGEATYLRKKRK